MIGGLLKDKRLSKGIALEKIAADLKIRVSFLKALEEENFDIFPADVYTMGYIRTYAMYLGIDPEPLIEEFKVLRERQKVSEMTVPEISEADKMESRSGFSFKPQVLIPAVIILIGGIAIFSIFKTTRQQKEFTLPVPPVPVQSSQTSSDNTLNQAEPSSQQVRPQAQAITPPPAPVAKKEPASTISPDPVSDNKSITQPSVGVSQKNKDFLETPEGYNLKIVANELSWLLVESEEGSHDITIKPGEVVQYTSKKGFKIKTGNAGGIKLFLNGKDMGSPGKSGEVKIINLP